MTHARAGFSLLLVIGALTAGALLASWAAQASLTDARVASAMSSQARLSAAADGALAWSAFQLADSETLEPIVADGRAYPVRIGSTPVTLRIVDETGLVDISMASRELLQAAFEAAGAEPALAQRLSAQTQDWRDADEDRRPLGAERADYRDAPPTAFIGNRAFVAVEELRALPAMNDALLEAAGPLFTVSGAEQPVAALAPPRVRAILEDADGWTAGARPVNIPQSGRYTAYIEARDASGAAFATAVRFDIVADRTGPHILSRRRLSLGEARTAIEGAHGP